MVRLILKEIKIETRRIASLSLSAKRSLSLRILSASRLEVYKPPFSNITSSL